MSGDGKRILPTSATTTAALIPITQGAYHGAAAARAGANDDLIDQLVGGLIQSEQPSLKEARFFGQNSDYAGQARTYSIDDEEIDEPPVPIPSTWRDQPVNDEPSWIGEQLRASAYGFAIGLFVVIPAVLLLTGQFDKAPSLQEALASAKTAIVQLGVDGSAGEPEQAGQPGSGAANVSDHGLVDRDAVTSGSADNPAGTSQQADATQQTPLQQAPLQQAPLEQAPAAGAEPARTVLAGAASGSISGNAAHAEPGALRETTEQAPAVPAVIASVSGGAAASATPSASVQPSPSLGEVQAPAQTDVTAREDNAAATARPEVPTAPVAVPPVAVREEPRQPPTQAEPEKREVVAAAAPLQPIGGAALSEPPLSIERARSTAKKGDMDSARVMLANLASRGVSEAIFALAETYDPNVLAAWGVQGEKADPKKAQMFYKMAQSNGVAQAGSRLRALQQ